MLLHLFYRNVKDFLLNHTMMELFYQVWHFMAENLQLCKELVQKD
jgi:hypothetical protein